MRPMLAEDFEESKLHFPLGAQAKIDGVRGLNMLGKLTGRSLKTHKNKYTTSFYSRSCLIGLDGELAAEYECHPDLCRITSSALSTIEGTPYTLWWLFDYVTFETKKLSYEERYNALVEKVRGLYHIDNEVWQHLRVIPMQICHNLEELLAFENKCLEMGFEGVCIRRLDGKHKEGRSTVREGGLLRIKRFIESEALVLSIEEGEENCNDAQVNELGKQFRSSHKSNMMPNGQLGSMTCQVLKDVFDPVTKVKVLSKDQIITVSPGNIPHDMRKLYWEHPELIVHHVVKFKFFPKGIKDKPRFPTAITIRSKEDM